MKNRVRNSQNSGFTMVEMLAVVAIIVILLGVTMVSVVRYRDLLKLTELDNAAREIYMAAENRAVLLSGAQRLSNQVDGAKGQPIALSGYAWHSGDEELRYVSKKGIEESGRDLLTVGSIDPALRESGVDFYLVYDQKSGSVTDVFYAESPMDGLVGDDGDDFEAFYDKWAKSRSERLALKNEMLVGWYNGVAAERANLEPESPKDEPTIEVIITNGEELTVTVKYTAPKSAKLSVKLGGVGSADSNSIPLPNGRLENKTLSGNSDGIFVSTGSGSYTWVLDSLTAGKFKDLEGLKKGDSWIVTPGDDFTVEAVLTPRFSGDFDEVSDHDTNNSLFQWGSGPTEVEGEEKRVFYIEYLRHLQNLDVGGYDSGVPELGDNIRAVQTGDIRCKDNETYGADGGYTEFVPIYNPKLERYDGGSYEIRNLYVDGTGFPNPAGLFSRMGTGTSNPPELTISDVRLVNAAVKAASGQYAGALMGEAHQGAKFQNCWVYWETDETVPDLKDKDALGNAVDGYHYQITGEYAGGLVGKMMGKCEVTGCLAATMVDGASAAGGLIGWYDSNELTIAHSYADCYLTGGSNASVAGLIGNLPAGKTVTLINCYTAGYIAGSPSGAAGLCLGEGTTKATNVYTVMRRIGTGDFSPLTANPSGDTFVNTYFLESSNWNTGTAVPDGTAQLTFTQMAGLEKDPEKNVMSAIAGEDPKLSFQWKTGMDDQSHPYNLRTDLSMELLVYDYPGLKGMPHYGDWTTDFKGTSLVYYEKYEDGTYGISGGNINTLKTDQTVLSDGYAVVCRVDDLKDQTEVTIGYTWYQKNGETEAMESMSGESVYSKGSEGFQDGGAITWKNPDGVKVPLYIFLKPSKSDDRFDPDKLSDSDFPEQNFYRYLNASVEAGSGTSAVPMNTRVFYNPHFAETVIPITASDGSITPENVSEFTGPLSRSLTEIKIRTPRHLYDLSRFSDYYTRRDTFHQLLDLDYSEYTGYGLFGSAEPYAQQPIGSSAEPFVGTYNGDYHVIRYVVPEVSETAKRQYAGLFGYSKGTLRNIVYEMNPEKPVSIALGSTVGSLYVGALAGGSSGTIDNCAVSGVNLEALASGVDLYVGGLVGRNEGTVRSCAAESARLAANCSSYARIYIGGLVGENAKSQLITTSYAVGRIEAEIDSTITTARICGFVGWNSGSIIYSYAAVDLKSSGGNVEAYGFCGQKDGSQYGNGFLDQGNFTYRDVSYTAKYQKDGDRAESVTYSRLSGSGEDAFTVFGMTTAQASPQKTEAESEPQYPYPTAVKGRNEKGELVPIHYGRWPTPMPLGDMGVFYWEKMVDADGGGNPTYHLSALAVDPEKNTITKQSTLSDAHNDGRVVTEYGYGYYADKNVEENLIFQESGIGYMKESGQARDNISQGGKPRFANEEPEDDLKNISPIELAGSKGAEEALANQTAEAGKYSFYCWTSFHEGGRPSLVDGDKMNNDRKAGTTHGLSIRDTTQPTVINGSGTFTLTQSSGQESISVQFGINPLFADSMSVSPAVGLNPGKGVSTDMPGTTEGNPFKIRCGIQLQQINWMNGAWTDTSVGFESFTSNQFPYLSGPKDEKKFYWAQTHDVNWTAEGNVYQWPSAGWTEGEDAQIGVFMGIAQTRATGNSSDFLPGWFSGAYDGRNYVIKNLKIGKNGGEIWGSMAGNAYDPNCMGLFGTVKGATLKNIVMYDESGESEVNVLGRKEDAPERDRWYVGGVLAGVALKGDNGAGEITNCAVAGYTIVDMAQRTRDQKLSDIDKPTIVMDFIGGKYVDMGGAIGGLVGMTDMDLTGCMASVTIKLKNTYPAQQSNGTWNVPLRVGGLVGSTTGRVNNCYTGGTIDISGEPNEARNEIYVGTITGGVGVVTGNYYTKEEVTISNCYSHMEVKLEENAKAPLKYARMNGAYGGTTSRVNDYYLGSRWMEVEAGGEQSVTYQQLANQELIDGNRIYDLLPGYSPVTTGDADKGISMLGRYSYAPANRPELQGMDYPFPTILTQPQDPANPGGATYKVHYGGWPLMGIEREDGGKRVELDIFTKRTYSETLKLSEGVSGGSWLEEVKLAWDVLEGQTVADDVSGFLKAWVDENGVLNLEALKASRIPVIATVQYQVGEEVYSLPIKVYIFDNLELRPNVVHIFPNDTVSVGLEPYGVIPGEKEYRPLEDENGRLEVQAVESSGAPVMAEAVNPTEDAPDAVPGVRLTHTGGEASEDHLRLDVTYTYIHTYTVDDGQREYRKENISQQIDVYPQELNGAWDDEGKIWTMDFRAYQHEALAAALVDGALADNFKVTPADGDVADGVVTLTWTGEKDTFPAEGVKLTITLTTKEEVTVDGAAKEYPLKHVLTITVLPKPEPEPGEGEETAP